MMLNLQCPHPELTTALHALETAFEVHETSEAHLVGTDHALCDIALHVSPRADVQAGEAR